MLLHSSWILPEDDIRSANDENFLAAAGQVTLEPTLLLAQICRRYILHRDLTATVASHLLPTMPSYIPPELVAEIVDHVASTGPGSRSDLERASLCCKLWRHFCLPHLYGKVSLAAVANEDFSEEIPWPYKRNRQWVKSCQLVLGSKMEDGMDESEFRRQSFKVLESSIQDLPNLEILDVLGAGVAPGVRTTIERILSASKIRSLSLQGEHGIAQASEANGPLILPYVTRLSLSCDPLQLFQLSLTREFPPIYSPHITSLSISHCSIDEAALLAITEGTALRALSIDSCKDITFQIFIGAASRHKHSLGLLFYRGFGDDDLEELQMVSCPSLKYLCLLVEAKDDTQVNLRKALLNVHILDRLHAPRLRVIGGNAGFLTEDLLAKVKDRLFYPSVRKVILLGQSTLTESRQTEIERVQIANMTRREVSSYFGRLA